MKIRYILVFLLFLASTTAALSKKSQFVLHFRNESDVLYESLVPNLAGFDNLWQTYEDTRIEAPVIFLAESQLDLIGCTRGVDNPSLKDQVQGRILVISSRFISRVRELCGIQNFWAEYASSFAVLCSYAPAAIIQEGYQSMWWHGKRWLSNQGRSLLQQYGFNSTCNYFWAYVGSSRVNSTLINEMKFRGVVAVDDSSLSILRGFYAPLNIMYFQYYSALVYFLLSALSVKDFLVRYRLQRLNVVYVCVYVMCAITALTLAVASALGQFFLFDIRSVHHDRLQFATFDSFLGVSCATDYLTTILYVRATTKLPFHAPKRRSRQLYSRYPIMFTIGMCMIVANLASSILLTLDRAPVALILALPGIEAIMQLGIIVYVSKKVYLVIRQLKAMDAGMEGTKKSQSRQQEMALEKRMRFWVKVSLLSSSLSMLGLYLYIMFPAVEDQTMYVLQLVCTTAGKQGNLLSQLMITSPVRQKRGVIHPITKTRSKDSKAVAT